MYNQHYYSRISTADSSIFPLRTRLSNGNPSTFGIFRDHRSVRLQVAEPNTMGQKTHAVPFMRMGNENTIIILRYLMLGKRLKLFGCGNGFRIKRELDTKKQIRICQMLFLHQKHCTYLHHSSRLLYALDRVVSTDRWSRINNEVMLVTFSKIISSYVYLRDGYFLF